MVYKYFFIITLSFVLNLSQLYANPSTDVPLGHWSYETIEKLAIAGIADISQLDIKPVSRLKMAYLIKGAVEKAKNSEMELDWNEQEYIENLLYRLMDEFRTELVEIGVGIAEVDGQNHERYKIKPVEDLQVVDIYSKLDAGSTLIENEDGWVIKDGFNARIKLTGSAQIDKLCAFSITPALRYSMKDDTDLNIENAHIRFKPSHYNVEFALGRAGMWWGPSFHGSLLMSNNAFPLDTLRINNLEPFSLPGVLKKLGRFNTLLFTAKLEDKRVVESPWLSGWRLSWTPMDFLKFGFGHILMFGGKGVRKLTPSNFIAENSLVFSSGGGDAETENHIVSWDAQYFLRGIDRFLPLASGAKIYGEWGAEDEAGNVPKDISQILGAYITDIFKIPGFDIKMEIAKIHQMWYTHFTYKSGYKYKGNFIGHHAGPDSEDIACSLIFNSPEEYKMSITFSRERIGLTQANIEDLNEIRLEFSLIDALNMYNIKDVEIDMFYEFEGISNYNNTALKLSNHIIGTEFRRRF